MANRLVLASDGLRGAVAFASKVIARKSSIPVLSHLRIRDDGDVRVEATDLENRIEIALPRLGGDGTFEAVLPARALADYLKGAADPELTLSADGLSVDVGSGRIVGWDPSDFPSAPRLDFETVTAIAPADLERALKSVYFARSTEVVRYSLTGVLFEIGKGKSAAAFVSSDGKRLAAIRVETTRAARALRTIVSPIAASLLSGLAKRAEGDVRIEVEKGDAERKALRFSAPGSSILTREIEGRFPDWEAVVPSESGRAAFRVDPAALGMALRTVEIGVSEKNRAAKFTFASSQVSLFAKTQDKGEGNASAPASGNGDAETVLSVDYVGEYLESLPKKTAEIEVLVGKKGDAVIFRIPDRPGVYVLMPLTIR